MNKYILPSTRSREFMNEIGKISNEFLSAWVNFVIVDLGRCHLSYDQVHIGEGQLPEKSKHAGWY